ncbi:MAG: SpoIIE family protein phosphatase [Deltaproteobacteria bacterium]|nr:SpoIIE family protein phosphatase [Deltaproteobacteria bacterium]
MPTQNFQHRNQNSPVFSKHTITVLLVDDQEIVAEAVRRMLAEEPDIKLEYCQDPTKALDMARQIHPTLILQDLIMPGIDGLTLVRFFRAAEATRRIPLIVLSSKEDPATKAEAFSRGANDYLVKLPDKVELIARIRYHSKAYITLLERNETYDALLASQAALESELKQAAAYVRALLPVRLKGDIRTDWEFIPSTSLGGDSFGYHWIDADHFAMYLLDVCGHGIGAALLSISVINALRSESLNHVDFRDPGQVLAELNQVFKMENHNDMFFTIWYGVYHKGKKEIIYAGGGHPPAIAITGETPETAVPAKLAGEGFIIGAVPDKDYPVSSFSLKPFTRLYIYSDGIYEVNGCGGKICMAEDFVRIVGDLFKENQAHVKGIIDAMKARQGKGVFDDDVSLLELDFTSSGHGTKDLPEA